MDAKKAAVVVGAAGILGALALMARTKFGEAKAGADAGPLTTDSYQAIPPYNTRNIPVESVPNIYMAYGVNTAPNGYRPFSG